MNIRFLLNIRIVFLIFMSLILLSCGQPDRPSDKRIKEQYLSDILKYPELMEIVKYEKINGYKESENTYIAEINNKIQFILGFDDFIEKVILLEEKINPKNAKAMRENIKQVAFVFEKQFGGKFSAGDTKINKLNLKFIKTEKGWLLKNVSKRE